MRPLHYANRAARLAFPQAGTVLHELVTEQPAFIELNGSSVRIPDPRVLHKTKVLIGDTEVEVVQLRPPWSTLDDIVAAQNAGLPTAGLKHQLARELIGYQRELGELGRALQRAAQYRLPCVWAKFVGHPDVPEGEVWTSFGNPTRLCVVQRFPQASSTSCRIRQVRRVTNYPFKAILINPVTLTEELQGDSDGDEGFVASIPGEEPAPAAEIRRAVVSASCTFQPTVQPNAQFRDLYEGFTATRYIGQIIQALWLVQYAHTMRTSEPQRAACEVWDMGTALVEHVMDARKLKAESQFDIKVAISWLRGTHSLPECCKALPYAEEIDKSIQQMVLTRPAAGVNLILGRRGRANALLPSLLSQNPIALLEQLWSGSYDGYIGEGDDDGNETDPSAN